MAKPSHEDLNNYGEGSYFLRDMLDERGNKGRRTHYYKGGVETVKDLAKEAGNVTPHEFPGTDMPLESVSLRKLDGGRAVRVDNYSHRKGAEAYTLEPQYQKLAWYHLGEDDIDGVPVSPKGHLPSEALSLSPTNPQDQLDKLTYLISYPYETTFFPLNNRNISSMIGKINKNSYSPEPHWEKFPPRTLLFTAPTVTAYKGSDGSFMWRGHITFMYRGRPAEPAGASGWHRMVALTGGGFEFILEHAERQFVSLEDIIG